VSDFFADPHLILNHFPVILTIVGAAAAVLALIVRRRGVWLYATATLALAGVMVVPTYLTGEGAEHRLEDSWYASHDVIEEHEEAGKFALWVVIGMGVIGAYAWWRARRSTTIDGALPVWLRALVVVAALFGASTLYVTAKHGGEIVHQSPQLQPGVGPPAPARDAPASVPGR
jgi:hypothetical protein